MTEETFLACGPYRPIRVVKRGEPPSSTPLESVSFLVGAAMTEL